jgi:hypothetical protein
MTNKILLKWTICGVLLLIEFHLESHLEFLIDSIAYAKNVQFPAGTEFFVLSRIKPITSGQPWSLFLIPIRAPIDNRCTKYKNEKTLDPKDQGAWLDVLPTQLDFRFFDNNDFDRVAFEVADIEKAVYVKTRKSIAGRQDPTAHARFTTRPDWNQRLFQSLDLYVPVSNRSTPLKANDVKNACPAVPQQKDGKPCVPEVAIDLPTPVRNFILNAAKRFSVPAAQIAATIHAETNFDLFRENESEKKLCDEAKSGMPCAPYKWGRSFAQLGLTDGAKYGLDWNQFLAPPAECLSVRKSAKSKPDSLRPDCLEKMITICARYSGEPQPINCPEAAINAVAQKLAAMIPSELKTTIEHKGRRSEIDLVPILTTDVVTAVRNRSGLYNRGPRVLNSYTETYRQLGRFPENYGEAWALDRTCESPTGAIGFKVLNREFINRCYVWKIAGLCGQLPKSSLYAQYEAMLGSGAQSFAPILKATRSTHTQ